MSSITSTSSLATTTSVAVDASDPAGLEALLVDAVPAGFVVQSDDVGDTGPSDLEKAVHDQGGTPEDRDFLVRNGFRRGYQRLWQNGEDDQLIVFLYEFSGAPGAKAQADTVAEQLSSGDGEAPGLPFDPGIAGALGFRSPDPSNPGAVVAFGKSRYAVQIVRLGGEAATIQTEVTQIARAQFDRLA
jgi:hypothetical protein